MKNIVIKASLLVTNLHFIFIFLHYIYLFLVTSKIRNPYLWCILNKFRLLNMIIMLNPINHFFLGDLYFIFWSLN